MKLATITPKLTKLAGRTGLVLKKRSPEILLVVGITGGVVSAVMACKATLKVEDVMANHKHKVGEVAKVWDKVKEGEIPLDEYSDMDHKKDLTVVYTQTTVDFIKLYGPAITLGAMSIACLIGGHGIMKKRNVALVAAYKVMEEGFSAYRKRVVDEFGEEKDFMFKNGYRAENFTETEVDEDGKKRNVKKTRLVPDNPTGTSIYARFFDESSTQWSKTDGYNFLFLHAQQTYFNNLLVARGHVFLNEVYDALGLDRSKEGAVVGWVLRKDGEGDNFIDFGIFDGDRPKARAFVNGQEKSILLDFNVDGVIWDLI